MEVLIDLDKISVDTLKKIASDYKYSNDQKKENTLDYYVQFVDMLNKHTKDTYEMLIEVQQKLFEK